MTQGCARPSDPCSRTARSGTQDPSSSCSNCRGNKVRRVDFFSKVNMRSGKSLLFFFSNLGKMKNDESASDLSATSKADIQNVVENLVVAFADILSSRKTTQGALPSSGSTSVKDGLTQESRGGPLWGDPTFLITISTVGILSLWYFFGRKRPKASLQRRLKFSDAAMTKDALVENAQELIEEVTQELQVRQEREMILLDRIAAVEKERDAALQTHRQSVEQHQNALSAVEKEQLDYKRNTEATKVRLDMACAYIAILESIVATADGAQRDSGLRDKEWAKDCAELQHRIMDQQHLITDLRLQLDRSKGYCRTLEAQNAAMMMYKSSQLHNNVIDKT